MRLTLSDYNNYDKLKKVDKFTLIKYIIEVGQKIGKIAAIKIYWRCLTTTEPRLKEAKDKVESLFEQNDNLKFR